MAPLRKTRLMRRVEREHGQPLETLLPEILERMGLNEAARELDITQSTLSYWLLKFGMEIRRVVLRRGDRLEIVRSADGER